ncbi:40S ribosomal protein S10-A [Histoplasma capsulatum]|uniref:40S ribosomal protein S10-A n=1 Tax=Ajellomyces capsulatus TaxID=5037 RepID=A0A8A1M9Y6_AJECA|nr:40S ribosomal protein S10-A [Histoplasma capsulatum]
METGHMIHQPRIGVPLPIQLNNPHHRPNTPLSKRFPELRQELATIKRGGKEVIKACQSLTSRGYLKTRFSWQYYYYTLTPEGLDYLREWLHLPAEIVPATHIKQQRSHAPPRGMMGGEERERRPGGRGGPRGDGGYRRREQGDAKEGGPPGDFAPSFRGGFGRGRGAPSAS